jgi:hypothetical protein
VTRSSLKVKQVSDRYTKNYDNRPTVQHIRIFNLRVLENETLTTVYDVYNNKNLQTSSSPYSIMNLVAVSYRLERGHITL